MGKDLHPSILTFFKQRMDNHQTVDSIKDVSNDEFYIYNINRKFELSDVIIVLSDSYYYGEFEGLSKPCELDNGGIVLIAKPEAHFSDESQVNDYENRILIGKIGVVLGALNKKEFWKYKKSQRKQPNQ